MLGSLGSLGSSLAVPSLGCRLHKAYVLVDPSLAVLAVLPSSGDPKKLNDFNAWHLAVLALLRRAWRAAKRSPSRRSRLKSEYVLWKSCTSRRTA